MGIKYANIKLYQLIKQQPVNMCNCFVLFIQMRTYSLCCLLLMSSVLMSYGQELSELTWKNRVIVMVSDDDSKGLVEDQIKEFNTCLDDLEERKLLVYQVLPDRFRVVQPYTTAWKKSDSWYGQFEDQKGDIKVFLIGLDGGIKLRKKGIVSCSEISNLIDQMPMRRAEMKNY